MTIRVVKNAINEDSEELTTELFRRVKETQGSEEITNASSVS